MWQLINSTLFLVTALFMLFNIRSMWKTIAMMCKARKEADESFGRLIAAYGESLRNLAEQTAILSGRIAHIYVVLGAMPMPIHARKLLDLGPEGIPRTEAERRKFVNDVNIENYKEMRTRLSQAVAESDDPEEKRRLAKMLEEADGLYNLFCTLDDKSSPEYFAQVMGEIPTTLQKMMEALNGEES